jgi:hypothetical protein
MRHGGVLMEDRKNPFFFPVRHHSPAAARAVCELIERLRPSVVLIEGPSDFNRQIHELYLPHRLPLAIYCYFRDTGSERRGAFYPFITYSPEWQALQKGHSIGAKVLFIDMPWPRICLVEATSKKGERPVLDDQRYADVHLRRSSYITRLCAELGVDDFDGLWDELFEIDPDLTSEEYVLRARMFCDHCRELDDPDLVDMERERFMARKIRETMETNKGTILVVTGGYHTSALESLVTQEAIPEELPVAAELLKESGCALTPYSNARLDSLTGYKSGMPGPGFYEYVWEDRSKNKSFDCKPLLTCVVNSLRKKGIQFSTADLVAANYTCRALADLRGHKDIWRRDLIDGLRGSVIKDDIARGGSHPLLDVVSEIFRGSAIGRLAEGTTLPPLMYDIEAILDECNLVPLEKQVEVLLQLNRKEERKRSRVIHCLRILKIKGFSLAGGTDIYSGTDMSAVQEAWFVKWTPEFAASVIEASSFGPGLVEAAANALAESAGKAERDIAMASRLLLDAALAGLGGRLGVLTQQFETLVRTSSDFSATAMALDNLLYLYCYDTVLELEKRDSLAGLLSETYRRCLYLLENLGIISESDKRYVEGIQCMVAVYERCAVLLALSPEETGSVFKRVNEDRKQSPMMRGAAAGVLWSQKFIEDSSIYRDLSLYYDPGLMGDYLTGLFALARETIQRDKNFLNEIDKWLMGLKEDEFLEAVPSLRLAFTFFTPREKYYLSTRLLEMNPSDDPSHTTGSRNPPEGLIVSAEQALLTLQFENRLYETYAKYGLKGGTNV